jgi:hypothetical protein
MNIIGKQSFLLMRIMTTDHKYIYTIWSGPMVPVPDLTRAYKAGSRVDCDYEHNRIESTGTRGNGRY